MPYILKAEQLETQANKITTLNDEVTNEQYPSAKAVNEAINRIANTGTTLVIDQEYNPNSTNPQSGRAVKDALDKYVPDINEDDLVGHKTSEGGEIFNDYESNLAQTPFTHSEGKETNVGIKGFKIKEISSPNVLSESCTQYVIKVEDIGNTILEDSGYEIGDIASIDGNINSHYYNGLEIVDLQVVDDTTTSITVNTKDIPEEVLKQILLESDDPKDIDNWFWVEGRSCGTPMLRSIGAHSEGSGTTATGYGAHSEGRDTRAIGDYSHSEGWETVAQHGAHAEGYRTQATGERSHTEGAETKAPGYASHAEGTLSESNGAYSHAEGFNSQSNYDSTHAEGYRTQATDTAAHAEGYESLASGEASHSEGYITKASGIHSHSEGTSTISSGTASHSEGSGTEASSYGAHSEGISTKASGTASHSEGSGTKASGEASHSEGYITKASGRYSHSEGYNTEASSYGAHSEGYGTKSLGETSHSEGISTKSSGDGAHSEGYNTEASGTASHSEGSGTKASGEASHSEGYNTLASGRYSHSEGKYAQASGEASHASGVGTIASKFGQFVVGQYNKVEDSAMFVVGGGNGNSDSARKTIFKVEDNGDIISKGKNLSVEIDKISQSYSTSSYKFVEKLPIVPSTIDSSIIYLTKQEENQGYNKYVFNNFSGNNKPEEDEEQIEVWDGVTQTAPVDSDNDGIYEITNAAELAYVIANSGKVIENGISVSNRTFVITKDIYLNDIKKIDWSTGEVLDEEYTVRSWYEGKSFNGTIDGNFHTIYGLYYWYEYDDCWHSNGGGMGLIPEIKYGDIATIKNLTIDYTAIRYGKNVGAFVGGANISTVNMDSCTVGSNVYLRGYRVGSLVGGSQQPKAVLTNCASYATMTNAPSNDLSYASLGLISNYYVKSIEISNCFNANGPICSGTNSRIIATDCFESEAGGHASGVTTLTKEQMQGKDVLNKDGAMSTLNSKTEPWVATDTYPILKASSYGWIQIDDAVTKDYVDQRTPQIIVSATEPTDVPDGTIWLKISS